MIKNLKDKISMRKSNLIVEISDYVENTLCIDSANERDSVVYVSAKRFLVTIHNISNNAIYETYVNKYNDEVFNNKVFDLEFSDEANDYRVSINLKNNFRDELSYYFYRYDEDEYAYDFENDLEMTKNLELIDEHKELLDECYDYLEANYNTIIRMIKSLLRLVDEENLYEEA